MYVNQLIITFVVFGILLFLMNSNNQTRKNKESFNQNNINNYLPYKNYYQFPNRYPKHINTSANGQFKNFNEIKYRDEELKEFTREDFSSETKYDNNMGPLVGKGDKKIVKIVFFLMLGGIIFLIYDNHKNKN